MYFETDLPTKASASKLSNSVVSDAINEIPCCNTFCTLKVDSGRQPSASTLSLVLTGKEYCVLN